MSDYHPTKDSPATITVVDLCWYSPDENMSWPAYGVQGKEDCPPDMSIQENAWNVRAGGVYSLRRVTKTLYLSHSRFSPTGFGYYGKPGAEQVETLATWKFSRKNWKKLS